MTGADWIPIEIIIIEATQAKQEIQVSKIFLMNCT